MSFQVACAKGCGGLLTVTDDMLAEAKKLGAPVVVAHDVCPKDQAVLNKYRIAITIDRIKDVTGEDVSAYDDDGDTIIMDDDGDDDRTVAITRLSQVGDTVEAASFADAFDAITKAINRQWESVSQMRHVVEGDG